MSTIFIHIFHYCTWTKSCSNRNQLGQFKSETVHVIDTLIGQKSNGKYQENVEQKKSGKQNCAW